MLIGLKRSDVSQDVCNVVKQVEEQVRGKEKNFDRQRGPKGFTLQSLKLRRLRLFTRPIPKALVRMNYLGFQIWPKFKYTRILL